MDSIFGNDWLNSEHSTGVSILKFLFRENKV